MDQVKIGKFIAQCRNEKNITQEELGEKLGVTNKTTSRWENGHYLPDIEMMQLLSKEFSISINELISGEKINDLDYKEKAEENLIVALENSTFTLKEKIEFHKKEMVKRAYIRYCSMYNCLASSYRCIKITKCRRLFNRNYIWNISSFFLCSKI